MRRTDQLIGTADIVQKVHGGVIAGQQQMIAVVDGHADRRIVVGTAAAPGERRGLVHDHTIAARGQFERGRKAGKTGADDVDRTGHQIRLRNRIKSSFTRE